MDEFELDKELSSQQVFCVYKHWGCNAEVELCDLGSHLQKCDFRPVEVEKSGEFVPAKDSEEKSKVRLFKNWMFTKAGESCKHKFLLFLWLIRTKLSIFCWCLVKLPIPVITVGLRSVI